MSRVGVTVTEYHISNDGADYGDHYWRLNVTLDDIQYFLKRSYVDFVMLDQKLKKQFPSAPAGELPLVNKDVVAKKLPKTSDVAPLSPSSSISGESSEEPIGPLSPPKRLSVAYDRRESSEGLEGKLTDWLSSLLLFPLYFTSEELLDFVTEDVTEQVVATQEVVLRDTKSIETVVKKSDTVSVPVDQAGFYVVWAWCTTNGFDLGFALQAYGRDVLPFARKNSHVSMIYGSFLMNEPGVCSLIFDNQHSKLRSKNLSYRVKVIRVEDYAAAKAEALTLESRNKRSWERRQSIRLHMHDFAADNLSVEMLTCSQLQASEDTAKKLIKELEAEVRTLKSYRSEIAEARESVKEANAKLEATSNKNEELKVSMKEAADAAFSKELSLSDEVSALHKRVSNHELQDIEAENLRKSLTTRLATSTSRGDALLDHNTTLTKSLEDSATREAEARAIIEDLQEKLKSAIARGDDLFEKNNVLEANLSETTADKDRLTELVTTSTVDLQKVVENLLQPKK
jgi:hypothetical protein